MGRSGYTAQLEEWDFDVKRWLLESCPRALGVCIMMRDDGNLSQEEILRKLEEDPEKDTYHERALEKSQKALGLARGRCVREWEIMMKNENQENLDSYEKSMNQYLHDHEKFGTCLLQVRKLEEHAKGEMLEGLFEFATEQLENQMEWLYKPSKPELYNDLNEYRAKKMEAYEWEVNYHHEHMEKEADRANDRLNAYKEVLAFAELLESTDLDA